MKVATMMSLCLTTAILLWCSTLVHSQADCSIDVVLVVDKSGSIGNIPGGWPDIMNFAIEFFDRIKEFANVGFVVFNDRPRTVFELKSVTDEDRDKMVRLRDNDGPTGWTNTSGALYLARELFTGSGNQQARPDVTVLVTDGRPTKGFSVGGELQIVPDSDYTEEGNKTRMTLFTQTRDQANQLGASNVRLLTVGVTEAVSIPLLESISDEFWFVPSTSNLMNQLQAVIDESCDVSEDTTTTTTTTMMTTTTTTTPPAFTGACIADVVLLIDSSGSITNDDPANWDRVRNFTVDLVESLGEIGPQATQVSLVQFSYNPRTEFYLGSLTKAQMISHIRQLKHLNSWTATASGIERVREEILKKEAGNRDGVPDIIILITDGVPTRFKNGTTTTKEITETKAEVKREAAMTRELGIDIVAVGVTDEVDTEFLEGIAGPENFIMVEDFDKLGATEIGKLRDQACVTTTTTTTTITTTPAPVTSACIIDLIILVDASGSIGPDNWESVVTFVTNFLEDLLKLQQSNLRVGVVCFSNGIDIALPFGDTTADDIEEAMNGLRFKGSYTATAEAMEQAITYFKDTTLNRASAPDYLLLMTDGFPTQKLDGSTIEKEEAKRNPAKKKEFYDEVRARSDMLKDMDVTIVGIAITNETDTDLLREIISDEETDFYKVAAFPELETDEFASQLQARTCKVLDPVQSACRVDVAMVVDNSGSVTVEDIEGIKDFLKGTVQLLFAKDESAYFALVLFANDVKVKYNLGESTEQEMEDLIDLISKTQGYTASAAALETVYENIFNGKDNDRSDAGNVLVFITDGQPTKTLNGSLITESASPKQREYVDKEVLGQATRLKDSGVTIMCVGVTEKANFTQLEDIADDKVFNVTQFSLLNDQLNEIIDATCQIGQRSACSIDIALVVDSSGSIGTANWEFVKRFLQDLVTSFIEVGINGTKIALINFSFQVTLEFNLGTKDLQGLDVVTGAIGNLTYKNSWTRTSLALRTVAEDVFGPSNPKERDGIPNVLLLMTDGRPSVFLNGSGRVSDTDMSEEAEARRQLIEAEMVIEANNVKADGTRIVALGITDSVKEEVMRDVVTDPDNDYFFVAGFESLSRVLDRLRSAVCVQ